MVKLLRLPLVLLIAVAMAVLWTWPATADDPVLTPTAEDCLVDPTLTGCMPTEQPPAPDGPTDGDSGAGGGQDGTAGGDDGTAGSGEGSAGGAEGTDGRTAGGETAGRTPAGQENPGGTPAGGGTYTPGGWVAGSDAAAAAVPELPISALPACDANPLTLIPDCPGEGEDPLPPLSCEALGELLGQEGCPDSFTCEDLAELFGLEECPDGPPTCEDLAALFGLEGCPEGPPGSCEEFAALLGLEDCEQIPCLDISQLPAEAKEGLAPLLEGLEQIGVTACEGEEEPPTTGGGQKPPTNDPPSGVQGTYYANCDDARAKGAAPVYAGQPGYRAGLDSDNDGIGCEDDGPAVTPATAQTYQTGELAYTGIELEPMLRGVAILISSGTLLLLAGVRRA
jgi:hypothetical protein